MQLRPDPARDRSSHDRIVATGRPAGARGVALALLLLAGSAGAQEDWTTERLDLELSFLPDDEVLLLEGELALVNASAEPRSRIELRVRDSFADELTVEGERIAEIAEPETMPRGRGRRFTIELAAPVAPGERYRLAFACAGVPQEDQAAVTAGYAYASWVTGWYPIVLQRDGSAPESTPIAPGRTVLHLPEAWHGVTNGERLSRVVAEGEAVETWESTEPVARSFAAGPFTFEEHDVGKRRVGVYTLTRTRSTPGDSARTLAAALEAMEARFGPYPYQSFRIAEAPAELGGWGASSEQGFLLVKPNFLQSPGGNLALFAHEAAHGWWGNHVGQFGPGSILLSESMAQYGAVIAIEALEGRAAATEFLRFSRPDYIPSQCARGYFQGSKLNDMPLALLTGGGWQHTLADAKGHWVLHMLRRRVGDELFFGTLRAVLEEYGGRRMSLDDLRAAFVERSPDDADVERFLAQWLDRTGAPRIEATWSARETGTEVVLHQVQPGEPFALRVPLDLVAADGTRRRVELRAETAEARAVFPGPPAETVVVDPDHELLLWSPEYE